MARIENFVLCEDIQNQVVLQSETGVPTLQPNIISPLSEITPVSIPGNYSFAMFGIVFDYDIDTSNEMVISIVDADDEECFSTASIKIPYANEKSTNKFIFAVNLRNFVFKREGNYKIVVKINHTVCFEKVFYVKAKGVC